MSIRNKELTVKKAEVRVVTEAKEAVIVVVGPAIVRVVVVRAATEEPTLIIQLEEDKTNPVLQTEHFVAPWEQSEHCSSTQGPQVDATALLPGLRTYIPTGQLAILEQFPSKSKENVGRQARQVWPVREHWSQLDT